MRRREDGKVEACEPGVGEKGEGEGREVKLGGLNSGGELRLSVGFCEYLSRAGAVSERGQERSAQGQEAATRDAEPVAGVRAPP